MPNILAGVGRSPRSPAFLFGLGSGGQAAGVKAAVNRALGWRCSPVRRLLDHHELFTYYHFLYFLSRSCHGCTLQNPLYISEFILIFCLNTHGLSIFRQLSQSVVSA
jgi:hypothetical protein